MNAFFDAIDLSANVQRGLNAVRGLTGLPALIMAIALGLISLALVPLVWYFDIDATLYATDMAANRIAPTLPAQAAGLIGMVTLALTLLPTLIELFGSRFASAQIKLAAAMVWFFCVFDMVTDWPRVAEFMMTYRGAFDDLGLFAGPVFFAFRLFLLFLASFGFELLLVVFSICAIVCAINASRKPAPRGAMEY